MWYIIGPHGLILFLNSVILFVGNFGVVYKGKCTKGSETVEVAIKTMRGTYVYTYS